MSLHTIHKPRGDANKSYSWDEFSNHSPVTISRGSRAYHGSIEGVHDAIHDIVVSVIYMSNLYASAESITIRVALDIWYVANS